MRASWLDSAAVRVYPRLVLAGFRRWSTYRTAAFAGLFTNIVFGFLRCAVLLTVFTSSAEVAGYDPSGVITFVWVGQGLLNVVLLWPDTRQVQRVRSGDIAIDLLRPWNLQAALLADDIGRASFAALVRFVPPMVVGWLLYDMYLPTSPITWLAFCAAAFLAIVVSFSLRFILSLTAFWLLDWRGVFGMYIVLSGLLAGLMVPIGMFPGWARVAIWCTPFPATVQAPADLLIGRGSTLALIGYQLAWAIALLALGRLVQRRGERVLVVQGG